MLVPLCRCVHCDWVLGDGNWAFVVPPHTNAMFVCRRLTAPWPLSGEGIDAAIVHSYDDPVYTQITKIFIPHYLFMPTVKKSNKEEQTG